MKMMEFGEEYAEDTIKNAKALAAALDKHGFDVQGKEFGYTQSHQVAVNVKNFQGGEKVSKTLELNDIILNMNMLPHEPLRNHDRPEGIRIGVQEMTRYRLHFRYAHLRLAIKYHGRKLTRAASHPRIAFLRTGPPP